MDGSLNISCSGECGKHCHNEFDKSSLRSSPATKTLQTIEESPGLCETPVRERRLSKIFEDKMYPSRSRVPTSGVPLSNLPILTTPPSRFNFVVQNPFDETLKQKLHLPFVSPTLFSKAASPSQGEHFSWSIEDLANMLPADIDEFQMQNDQSYDEQTEQEVQKSISRFFESNSIVPSPWGTYDTFKPIVISDSHCTPMKSDIIEMDHVNAVLDYEDAENPLFPELRREAWTQTEITIPIEIHTPFDSFCDPHQFGEIQEQKKSAEEMTNVEKNSTKMQNAEKNSTKMQDDLVCSSPCYSLYKSLLSSTIHTPKNKISRSFGTSLGRDSVLSPIGLSPIVHSFQQVSTNFEISRDSIESVRCTCHSGMSCDSGISSASSQTDVTFPSILPKNIEEVLKPFQTFIQDLSEIEDVNLNLSLSHRRKLLFSENLDMSVSSVCTFDNGYSTS